jgi:hypothetical protein
MEKKRELLVTELLISKVKVNNILPDIPIITTRYIDFLPITANNIRKTIIEASNTTLRVNKVLIAILQIA